MFLKQIHIENYRLLMEYDIVFDRRLTLLVGKNNTGKTSLMNLMKTVINGEQLKFEDYPIQCRDKLYHAVFEFWSNRISFEDCVKEIPISKICFNVDYSDEAEEDYLGGLSSFIIDLDEVVTEARIVAKYAFSMTPQTLQELKLTYQETAPLIERESNTEQEAIIGNTDNENVEEMNTEVMAKVIEQKFGTLFSLHIEAVNPTDEKDTQEKSKKELRDLFILNTIGAERSLDETEKGQEKPLSVVMNRLFKSDVSEIEEEIVTETKNLKKYVDEQSLMAENIVNGILSEIVDNMFPFGYPTAEDMQLYARTQFSMKNDIINNTDLEYVTEGNKETLPSTHNGLGYKNLIKITLLLKEFARTVKQNAMSAIPILFLEEPEAHMHPQLQEVFVGHLENVLSKFTGNPIQIVMSTHSPHIANTVSFENVRYLRREVDRVSCKDLNDFSKKDDKPDDEHEQNIIFLQKYLTLSRCDLYFCDKAILIEGASERLLIPDMIKKCEKRGKFMGKIPTLTSQYCSLIEVGGAYAHCFFNFIDFLEIPTLILTDIDFVGKNREKAFRQEAVDTSNATIKRWCHDVLDIAITKKIELIQILELTDEQKTNGFRHIEFQLEENGAYPRSLEEAIINVNREYYGIDTDKKDIDFDEKEEKKTDFALNLVLGKNSDDYQIPSYIEKGLIWLNEQSKVPMSVQPKKKFKRSYNKESKE